MHGVRSWRRGGEQRDADGLVLKDGQDELAPRLVREFLAAEGFELVKHLLRRAAAGGHENGRIHRSRFFRGEHAQRVDIHLQFVAEAFGAAFHFGDDAGRDLRKLLAEGAPDPGLKLSGGVFQLKPPERAVLGLPAATPSR